jgi:hypothetical protein
MSLSSCGVLAFTPLDISESVSGELLFDRASREFAKTLPSELVTRMMLIYAKVQPEVVKFVMSVKNPVYHRDSDRRMPGGEHWIASGLSYQTALLCFHYFEQSSIADDEDGSQLKMIIVLSFYTIFSAIVDQSVLRPFDTWLTRTFEVELPKDWVGFNVPDAFWDTYEIPSLGSMRFYKGKLYPLDFSMLNGKPAARPRSCSASLKLPQDFMAVTPQHLATLFNLRMLARGRSNILLIGPRGSGKSSLLYLALNTWMILFQSTSPFLFVPLELRCKSLSNIILQLLHNHICFYQLLKLML